MSLKSNCHILAASIILSAGSLAFAETEVTTSATSTTESVGTISDFGGDTISIRSESSPAPVIYHYSKTTTYVDDAGAPVSIETVKSGLPVTVHYIKRGDGMVADRVIVHRKTTTTTTAPATVEERKTSTTTTTTK